jgi:hypothetical protein
MRFHKGSDGWGRDSYRIPQFAVVGSSCTGDWPDSPCPTLRVKAELEGFRKELRKNKIRSRVGATQSGNVFCVKVWVKVAGKDFAAADKLARDYLKAHQSDTRYIHDAD